MQRFFVEPFQVLEEEHRITLTGPDLNHMKNVLRMRIGEAQTKERFLRYPPFVCSCLVLICTKKYERQKAHCGKIYYNVFQHIFVLV